MKKFREKMAAREGFTLVELIVVIAILGILAAVAVPTYTGYITKAHEARDTQLLSAANTAFAAACVENGIPNTNVTTATLTVNNSMITGVSVTNGTDADGTTPLTDAQKTAIASSFEVYFSGNTGTKLEYYTNFSFSDGNFVGKVTPAAVDDGT